MDRALAVDGSVGRRFVGARRLANERGVLLGLAIVTLAFGALVGPQFFAAANIELMARQTVIVCVAALGMTMIIVSGGIDLSVGSIVALATVVTALLLSGIRNEWDLITWIAPRPDTPDPQFETAEEEEPSDG